MKRTILIFILVLLTTSLHAETRGVKRVEIRTSAGESVGLYEESHALVIGVSDYTAGWPRLRGVRDDVREVRRALEDNGFSVTLVENPDTAEFERAVKEFIVRHGRHPDNRLLFYYAGHGFTQKLGYGGDMGYLVPRDAPDPNRDLMGFELKAISMQNIETYARTIGAKHALFVFDACFAGSIFNVTRAIPKSIELKTAKPVRQFLTSGSADQEVPDKSVFRIEFVRALQGDGDLDGDGYMTASELGQYLETKVVEYRGEQQTPQYGKLNDPLLNQGDFVFALRKAAPESVVAVATPAQSPKPEHGLDAEAWEMVKDSGDPEDLQFFIEEFPDSRRTKLARLKLKMLERKQAKTQAEEKQLAEEAQKLEAERQRLEAEKQQLAEAKHKEEERQRQEKLAALQAKTKRSLLTIKANVVGSIFMDDVYKGKTGKQPLTLKPGKYQLRVSRYGYAPYETRVSVRANETKTIYANLKRGTRTTAKTTLRVEANVRGSVYLNDRYRGKTGSEIKLQPGNYNLVVGRAGYKSYSTRVTLSAGQKKTARVTLGKARQVAVANTNFDESSMKREYNALQYNPSKDRYQAFINKYQNEPRAKNQVAVIRSRLSAWGKKSGKATLHVEANVVGSVFLNDRYRAKTGKAFKLPPGNYNLMVGRAGYKPYSTRVKVGAGENKTVHVILSQQVRGMDRSQYEAIVKASEDTVSCGLFSFGCEDPLKLPPYDPGFHIKHYRRVKVYASRYPWAASEISLRQGDQVLVLASGKVTTCRRHDCIGKPPNRNLTLRIGENRKFFKFHGRNAGEGVWNDFRAQRNGGLQFTIKDWRTYPPPADWYKDNTGSFLLDVFVYENENKAAFQQFLQALIRQNPEDTAFVAQAQGFLK